MKTNSARSYEVDVLGVTYCLDLNGRYYDSAIDFRFYRKGVPQWNEKTYVHRDEVQGQYRMYLGISYEDEKGLFAFFGKDAPHVLGHMIMGVYAGVFDMGQGQHLFPRPDIPGLVEVEAIHWNDPYPESER